MFKHWIEIDTGKLYTKEERDSILINKYGFDEITYASEIWEFFTDIEKTGLTWKEVIIEWPDAVKEYLNQYN